MAASGRYRSACCRETAGSDKVQSVAGTKLLSAGAVTRMTGRGKSRPQASEGKESNLASAGLLRPWWCRWLCALIFYTSPGGAKNKRTRKRHNSSTAGENQKREEKKWYGYAWQHTNDHEPTHLDRIALSPLPRPDPSVSPCVLSLQWRAWWSIHEVTIATNTKGGTGRKGRVWREG